MNTSASEYEAVDPLTLWHQQYMEADAKSISMDSPVIQAVQSDELDYNRIEVEVEALVANADVLRGFCGNCRWLLDHWPGIRDEAVEDDFMYKMFTPGRAVHTREIEASARAGCKFCLFLFSNLRTNSELDTFRRIERRLRLVGSDETTTISVSIDKYRPTKSLWLNYPQKMALCSTFTGAEVCHTMTERVDPTSRLWHDPPEPLDIAKMWLANCCKAHEDCRTKQYRPPTRLLCVTDNRVRLIITKRLRQVPQYASLSYCWGKEPFIKLSRSNLRTYMDCIPWEELPKTFQDAIEATRKLGLNFIWIDALCIVQDSGDDDWAIEAGRMSSVYRGAFVSLAAGDARNVYEGFLRRTSQNYYSGGFLARVTSKEQCEVRRFYNYKDYGRIVTNCHLSTRGWALQEKLLPMRTIHFSDSGLWWNCRSQTSSQYLPDGRLMNLVDTPFLHPMPDPWNWSHSWDWAGIAWHYSGTDFTYGSDRLAALSGIAACHHEETGDQYLAGLWRKGLIYDLLWRLEEHREDPRPSGTQRPVRNRCRPNWWAPTWSWLSVEGKVAFGKYSQSQLRVWNMTPYLRLPGHETRGDPFDEKSSSTKHFYVRVLEAKTTPSGPDPFGPVSSGQLTIACSKLICGRLGHAAGPEDLGGTVPWNSGLGVFPVVIDCWEDDLFKDERVVYLLPFLRGTKSLWGLVIQADNLLNLKGQFRRVGCFSFIERAEPEHQENHFLNFTELLEKLGDVTAAAECAQTIPVTEDEDRRYVITLV